MLGKFRAFYKIKNGMKYSKEEIISLDITDGEPIFFMKSVIEIEDWGELYIGNFNKSAVTYSFYTTLNDSDGKEIYQGDGIYWIKEDGERFSGIVCFDNGAFIVLTGKGERSLLGDLISNYGVKLMGQNAYQNPGLLGWYNPEIIDRFGFKN